MIPRELVFADLDDFLEKQKSDLQWTLMVVSSTILIVIIIVGFVASRFSYSITQPIQMITEYTNKLKCAPDRLTKMRVVDELSKTP